MSEEQREERENKIELSTEESKNRLAAVEFDMHKIVDHRLTGTHPNLNET